MRSGAWFFLLASAVGFVGGIAEAFASLETGVLTIPIPVAVGMTGLALFRGLRAGHVRAWRWARRLAVAGAAGLIAMCILALLAPDGSTFSGLGGSWPVATVLPILIPVSALGIVWFAWLFRALGSPAARDFFGSAPDASEPVHVPPTEAAP